MWAEPQQFNKDIPQPEYAKARVLDVDTFNLEGPEGAGFDQTYQDITLRIISGKYKGKEVKLEHMACGMIGADIILKVRDKVLVYVDEDPSVVESPDGEPVFHVADYIRYSPLFWFAFFYCLLLVVIGGVKGFRSLVSLIITIAMLFLVFFPLVLPS